MLRVSANSPKILPALAESPWVFSLISAGNKAPAIALTSWVTSPIATPGARLADR